MLLNYVIIKLSESKRTKGALTDGKGSLKGLCMMMT